MPRPTISGSGMPIGILSKLARILSLHAQHRVVLVGADDEARRHHGAVVLRLAVDVLDAGDRLDDRLQRLGHQLDRVGRLQAVGLHDDVDHRHADLRLFLARNGQQRDQARRQRREQEQRRQRRADRRPRQPAGKAEVHGCTSTSPALTPERISSPSGCRRRAIAAALHRRLDQLPSGLRSRT